MIAAINEINRMNAVYLPDTKTQTQKVETSYTTSPQKEDGENLLSKYMQNQGVINSALIGQTKAISTEKSVPTDYKNNLRAMFQNNEAKILAIIPRTFNANDKNGDDILELNLGEEAGNFNNAIKRLDEVKANGFNTLHILPIFTTGKKNAKGTAGSLYATDHYLEIYPMLDDKNDSRTVREEFQNFVKECHKRGIKVMLDLPSCASVSLFNRRPELMAMNKDGSAKVPQGWDDIRMFNPFDDEEKRTLNQTLFDMHKKVVDN